MVQTRTATDEQFMTEDELCGESEAQQESSLADKSPPKKVQKRARLQNIVTPDLALALDRINISDWNATFVLAAAAAESHGHDISTLFISRSSIQAARFKNRSQLCQQSKDIFLVSDVPLTNDHTLGWKDVASYCWW